MKNNDAMTIIQTVMDMLTGRKLPDGVKMDNAPGLSEEQAWSAVWFLQEVMDVLPANVDRCDRCGALYDTESELPGYISRYDTDKIDEEDGITQEVLNKLDGKHFCSYGCFFRAIGGSE